MTAIGRVTNRRSVRIRALLIPIALGTGAACSGVAPVDRTLDPDASWSADAAEKVDASIGPAGDGSVVINPHPPDGPGFVVDRAGPIIGPDGSISWPRSDGAVETPDAATWDAGAGCPVEAPNADESCLSETFCVYPLDCCGVVAGSVQAYCRFGAWTIDVRSNGEFCAPCEPFPLVGEACLLEAACRSGPPPICARMSCYGKATVARCIGHKWRLTEGCSK
jgi:hypothetical protein